MNFKISVIMPIYNAEKYLENTLNSVINQTIGFENIELILVDDCSTDNSRDIMEEYSENYSNIKSIFLDENSGWPSIPRNVGIKNASADYIMFIDNDDEYFPEICDKLYNTLISEDADIVVCGKLLSANQNTRILPINSDEVLYDEEIVYFDNVHIWNCIFKKSIILESNISFIDGVNEDSLFTLEYYLHSKKLVYLKDFVGYNHIQRNDSLGFPSFNFTMDLLKSSDLIIELLEEGGGKYDLSRFFKQSVPSIIGAAVFLANKYEIKEVLSELYDFERKINFKAKLPIIFHFINFFILHKKINCAVYICLFFSKFMRSNLLLKIYRDFFK